VILLPIAIVVSSTRPTSDSATLLGEFMGERKGERGRERGRERGI